MKTNLLFSSLVISALSVNAQITITTSDMPIVGETYISANDTNVTSFGSAGANQTWNFASWGNHTKDTVLYYNPSSVPGNSFFSTATLAMGDSSGSVFVKNSASSFDMLGFYVDFGTGLMPITYTPPRKMLSFPSNYLTTYNGTSKYEIKIYFGQMGIDSAKIKASVNYTSLIDAWGTITTPASANLNSLRQKVTDVSNDSLFLKPTGLPWVFSPSTPQSPNPTIDTTNTYTWFSNTKKSPVATITADANNVVTNASYLLSTTVGVNELAVKQADISVFPNPASDKITISGNSTESILLIFDVNGKLVENNRLKKSSTSINTSAYENGTYFYHVTALNGKTIGKGLVWKEQAYT